MNDVIGVLVVCMSWSQDETAGSLDIPWGLSFVQSYKGPRKSFYNNLNVKSVTDNKLFWTTVKPCFSDKSAKLETITLVENGNVISNDKDIAEKFNHFYGNILETLNIEPYNEGSHNVDHIQGPVLKAILKYQNHPSIIKIKQNILQTKTFSFQKISKEEIEKQILSLDTSKAQQQTDIPTRIIKQCSDIFTPYITQSIDLELKNSYFPNVLKKADIKPIYKKKSRTEKSNYRPVSILPNISKIYEKCIYEQLEKFFDPIFSKHQFGFRKGHSAQQCLIFMVEKWKKCLDTG